jgi:dTDP-4-amino-4,6-dideoxygalactose transaminase
MANEELAMTIPIAKPWLGAEEEAAVAAALKSGWITQGPRVAEFEQKLAETVGAAHGVAVTSCTTALHLIFVALGIGPGDEVVCPSFSFIASCNAIVHAGGTPVFVDIDERTFNLDPTAVERAIGPRTRAILAVHQIGMPAAMDELSAIARSHNLHLVEDAACAMGSTYQDRRIGKSFGIATAFSFHPRKILTTGEGGMITTESAELAARLRRLRHHGMSLTDLDRHRSKDHYVREVYGEVGFNFRMTDLQAAVGLVQLGRLDTMLARRRQQAARYNELLAPLGRERVEAPFVPPDRVSNFQSYMIRFPQAGRAERDAMIDQLLALGITTRPGIMASHLEPPYAGREFSLPVTEHITDQTLMLPIFHDLSEAEQQRVVDGVGQVLAAHP